MIFVICSTGRDKPNHPYSHLQKTLTVGSDAQVTQVLRVGAFGVIPGVLGARHAGAAEEAAHLPREVTVVLVQQPRLHQGHHGDLPA